MAAETASSKAASCVDHRDGRDVVLKLRDVRTQFGDTVVHDKLDLDVFRGEIVGLVGGSGTGKSVLLRTIIGLNPARQGHDRGAGHERTQPARQGRAVAPSRTGVLFQDGALFSSLTVAENVIVPIREHAQLDEGLMREIAALKIALVGLPPDTGRKKPSELSGGMRKRPASPGRWRSIPTSSSWTSRPRASTRSAPRTSTSWSRACRTAWAHGLHGHPRPRQPLRGLRPHRGAPRQARRGGYHGGNAGLR